MGVQGIVGHGPRTYWLITKFENERSFSCQILMHEKIKHIPFTDTKLLSVLRVLSTYMVWRSIKDSVPLLCDKFRAVHQKFKKRLLGSKTNKTREEVCFSYTNNILGPMLGALFIRNAFGPDSKEKVGSNARIYFQNCDDVGREWLLEWNKKFDWLSPLYPLLSRWSQSVSFPGGSDDGRYHPGF